MANTITIVPSNPTSSDSVVFQVTGPIGCGGPTSLVLTQTGNVFNGYVSFGSCFTTPPPLFVSFNAGRLAPGNYTVVVAESISSTITTSASFSVTAAANIPAVGPVGLVLMAAAVLLVTIPTFMRRR